MTNETRPDDLAEIVAKRAASYARDLHTGTDLIRGGLNLLGRINIKGEKVVLLDHHSFDTLVWNLPPEDRGGMPFGRPFEIEVRGITFKIKPREEDK